MSRTYRARMIDVLTPGETTYDFDARDDLMSDTPVRIVRSFFDAVDHRLFAVAHRDWEVNAAMKRGTPEVACVMGVLHREDGPPVPFTVFVGPK